MKKIIFILFVILGFSQMAESAVIDQIRCDVELTSLRGHTAKAQWNSDVARRITITQAPNVKMTEANLFLKVRLEEEDLQAVFRLNYLHATETVESQPRSAQIACMTGALMQGDEDYTPFGCPDWMKEDVFGSDTFWSQTLAPHGYEDFDSSAVTPFESELNGLATLKVNCQHLGTQVLRLK